MPMFAWMLVFLVVNYVIQALITPGQQERKPASSEEIEFPQEEEGTPQAVVFGDVWTSGYQTLWHGLLRTIKIKKGGKK